VLAFSDRRTREIGRGVLIDAARYKGKKHLDRDEGFTLDDLLGASKKQGVTIENTTSSYCTPDGSIASTRKGRRRSSRRSVFDEPASR